jgi:hypothetical protein
LTNVKLEAPAAKAGAADAARRATKASLFMRANIDPHGVSENIESAD